ncbi:MAG: guanylate kinase [Legionellales bacterium]|nr:guanylate kinase [Legionellales bacterium]
MVTRQTMDSQLIFVLTAASATGKTSCAKLACAQIDALKLSISHSTRPPRPGEQDGVDKYFITPEQFSALDNQGQFIEQTKIFGHRCGHTREKIQVQMRDQSDLLMILDYAGMCQIKRQFDNTVSVFLLPPSTEAIVDRIHKRPEADGVDIDARLVSARCEMQDYIHYDYIVFNDHIDHAVADLLAIVRAERLKTTQQRVRNRKCIEQLQI